MAEQYLETILPGQIDQQLAGRLPLEFLKQQCAVPVTLESGQVAIAMADKLNTEAYDAILTILGQSLERVICPASEIEQAISRCYYQGTDDDNDAQAAGSSDPEAGDEDTALTVIAASGEDLLNISDKAPVIKLVNKILFQAVHSRASDIHVEPYETETRVRFRIDGVLHDVCTLPQQQVLAVASRLKVMADLNIAERRLPQDGQSRIKIGPDQVDIRVSTIPTSGGERIVLRLLDSRSGELTLENTGFSDELLASFRNMFGISHGIILLTGPTGSGKTTTLYGVLNELNCEERNILTVEDPIEYQLHGVGQMHVKPKIDLTFSTCLRHILRQDPDVIMIGEIRDVETAEIAIQASLTGHLVLSTLHTNDAASAITRLIDMGIEPYLISSSVVAVMAQRLLRVICPGCKTQSRSKKQTNAAWLEKQGIAIPKAGLFRGAGCDDCLETGYLGRSGIFELLTVDDEIKELIIERRGSHIIKEAAIRNGMGTLRDSGLQKVLAGETTVQEVCRVTQDSTLSHLGAGERVSC